MARLFLRRDRDRDDGVESGRPGPLPAALTIRASAGPIFHVALTIGRPAPPYPAGGCRGRKRAGHGMPAGGIARKKRKYKTSL